MQPHEQCRVTRQVAAIKKRNGELSIVWIEAVAFCQSPRCRTQLELQIPKLLRKSANRLFVGLPPAAIRIQKKQIDIGIRKQPAAPEAPSCHQREAARTSFVGRHQIPPKTLENLFDQPRPLRDRRTSVSGQSKLARNSRGFLSDRIPQFSDQ